MAKLQIRIFEINDKTVSKFEVSDTEKVVFFNHGTDVLTIAVKDSPMPGPVLCGKRNNKEPVTAPFTISVTEQKKAFFVCDSYMGDSFTYSAEIKGAAIEDPIVIIEKSNLYGYLAENALLITITALTAIALTLIVERVFFTRRPT
jgi:hypothetical protein